MGAFLCLVWKARQRYNKNIEVIRNVVSVCFGVGGVRGPDIHPGQGGHRGGGLQPGHRYTDGRGPSAGLGKGIQGIGPKSWLFLILSGLATGASWLCYYHALQIGAASKVVPVDKLSVVITLVLAFVFLHEPFTSKSLFGCVLIGAGTLLMVL